MGSATYDTISEDELIRKYNSFLFVEKTSAFYHKSMQAVQL